jgi:hypothetical protein
MKKLAEFFTLRNWRCLGLYLHNHRSYGQTENMGGFSASNWSKTDPPRFSDCRLLMLYKEVKKLWPEFFALRLWRCSGQPCNNQQTDGQMDVTVGFSRSERSRNNLGRHFNCSGRFVYGRETPIGLSGQNTHGSRLPTHIPQIA